MSSGAAGCCRVLQGVAAGFGRSARRRPPDATATLVGRGSNKQLLASVCLRTFYSVQTGIQTWQHSVLWRMQGACFGTRKRNGTEPTTRDAPRRRVHHSCKSAECRVFCAEDNPLVGDAQPQIRGSDRRRLLERPAACAAEGTKPSPAQVSGGATHSVTGHGYELEAATACGVVVVGQKPAKIQEFCP